MVSDVKREVDKIGGHEYKILSYVDINPLASQ